MIGNINPLPPMTHESLLENFYAALKAADAQALARCVDAGFELNWQGTPAIPWAGVWKGVDGLLQFFGILNQHVEVLEVTRLHTLSGAELTFVLLQGRWRLRTNGKELSALAANVFTFHAGTIRSNTVLNNTAAFAEAL